MIDVNPTAGKLRQLTRRRRGDDPETDKVAVATLVAYQKTRWTLVEVWTGRIEDEDPVEGMKHDQISDLMSGIVADLGVVGGCTFRPKIEWRVAINGATITFCSDYPDC